MKPTFFAVAILALMCEVVSAQSPYAGQRDAPIKALLPEEQSALRAGQGLGFAMAAELNGYPGPKHVLELAEQLELSDDQRRATQELFERMLATAQREGAALIEAERELDGLYASRTATAALVNERLTRIETLRARLRGTHLNAHLEQAALLTPHQLHLYAKLRGYAATPHHH